MTLNDFILARVAEDEAAARFGTGPWRSSGPANCGCCVRVVDGTASLLGDLDEPQAEHILRHDPARVLRQCEATRRVVQQAFECAATVDGEWGDSHNADEIREGKCSDHGADVAKEHLVILASIWSDHPDYDEEWRA